LSKLPTKEIGKNPPFHQGVNDADVSILANQQAEHVSLKVVTKKRKGAIVKQSVCFMKKVARMSTVDRKQSVHFLKKQKRYKKSSKGKHHSKQTDIATSESSKNSNSSVDNDWENWVILHGKPQVMVDDVKAIGKTV